MFAVQEACPSEHLATTVHAAPACVFFRKVHDAAPALARFSASTMGTAVLRSLGFGQAVGHQVPVSFCGADAGSPGASAGRVCSRSAGGSAASFCDEGAAAAGAGAAGSGIGSGRTPTLPVSDRVSGLGAAGGASATRSGAGGGTAGPVAAVGTDAGAAA